MIEQRDLGEVRTGHHRCARYPVEADLGAAFDDELRAGLGRALPDDDPAWPVAQGGAVLGELGAEIVGQHL